MIAEKESADNIIYICGDCSKMRKLDWQDHNKETIIRKDDFVKTLLMEGNEREHCWIKVVGVSQDGKILWGILDNIPIVLKKYSLGSAVVVQRGEIEDHKSTE
jgi:uncharacterized protein YegJ (DUF2314 family)